MLGTVPENEIIVLNALRSNLSYAFGWVEDRAEVFELAEQEDEARAERAKAIELYHRASDLGKHYLRLRHRGFDEAYTNGFRSFRTWLEREFDDSEDAADLWWAGYAWGLYINAKYPREHHDDRDFAVAMVRRSVRLDPTYYGSSGLAFLAYVATQRPGANQVEEREAAWERALEVSERKNLLIQLTMAQTHAVRVQDRELFLSLLREILEAGDLEPSFRLSNMIAKRKAARYVQRVDEYFPIL